MQRTFCVILAVLACVAHVGVQAQTLRSVQYASSVIAFSSEYNPSPATYSAQRVLGVPDAYPHCGSNVNAWTSATASSQREFLVLGFSTPQQVNTIRVYQAVAPGAIDTIYLRDATTSTWHTVYTAVAAAPGNGQQCPGQEFMLLEVTIPTTPYNVNAIRIAINSPAVTSYWNEIDAVSIANFDVLDQNWTQYADTVIDFSSEWVPSPGSYSVQKALGAPDVPSTTCTTHPNAWASLTASSQREYLVLGYAFPAHINRVAIYQVTAPGAVDTVYLRNASTGTWHTIYTAVAAATPCPYQNLLEINFTRTPYPVDAVRIAINSPAVASYWNEIDAVGIRSELPAGAILSAKDGNWDSTSTWLGGIKPVAGDTVIIGASHDVSVSGTTAGAKDIYITHSGKLILDSASALSIGPGAGGTGRLEVSGSVLNNKGHLFIGGSVRFNAYSTFNMVGGTLTADGNDGTAAGSVADSVYIADFLPGMNQFSFTGGTLTLVDPAFGASGKTIRAAYNFGAATTLKVGNGVSTTAGGHANGFILTELNPTIGHLMVDAATIGNNRQVTVGDPLTVLKSCTVVSGKVNNASNLNVLGP